MAIVRNNALRYRTRINRFESEFFFNDISRAVVLVALVARNASKCYVELRFRFAASTIGEFNY